MGIVILNSKNYIMNLDSKKVNVKGTVKIGGKSKTTNFSVLGGDTKTNGVSWNLRTAKKQSINVHFKITASGRKTINRDMPGSRKLDSYLINAWDKGNFDSKEASINYHFNTHGAELNNGNNIKDYALQAYKYKGKCKRGKGRKVGDGWKFNFTILHGTLSLLRMVQVERFIHLESEKQE